MAVFETTRLPTVRLDVSHAGRSVPYVFDQVDFLIGAVAGCDLRVPGGELPAVLCLLARHPGGISLRRLAPTQVVLLNGAGVSRAELHDGDRLTIGAVDVHVRVESLPVDEPEITLEPIADEADDLAEAHAKLAEERSAFEARVRAWEAEKPSPRTDVDLLKREVALAKRDDELTKQRQLAEARAAEIERQRREIAVVRQELNDIRQQLYDRYQERRDRLSGLQEAVDKAARKVQEGKRDVEQTRRSLAEREDAIARQSADIESQRKLLTEESHSLEEQRRFLAESQKAVQTDVAAKLADLAAREDRFVAQRATLDARERQYQDDVVRLDRQRGAFETREKAVVEREAALAARERQLVADSEDLEAQARECDALRVQAQDAAADLERRQAEFDGREAEFGRRAASLEGQQAALATLRTKLERTRDELRRQEMEFDARRQAVEALAADADARLADVARRETEIEAQVAVAAQERQQIAQRQTVLGEAVVKLREAQDRIAAEEQRLVARAADLERGLTGVAEKEAILQGRLDQLAEAQQRLDLERQTLRERTLSLAEAERARQALQEQLRKRSDDLAERQRRLDDESRRLGERESHWAESTAQREAELAAERERQQAALTQLASESAEAASRKQELAQLHELQRRQLDELHAKARDVAEQERALAEQQARNQDLWRTEQQRLADERARLDAVRAEAKELLLELPDLELRAGTAVDRLGHAREQLRDHLAELNAYVRQTQDEFDAIQSRVRHEQGLVAQKDQELRRLQDEHRIALVGFRQQLIEWQGQVGELQRLIGRSDKALDHRQARVDEQARQVDAAASELARESDLLETQQRVVAERKADVERQLGEMRDWYRAKLRELAGVPVDAAGDPTPIAVSEAVPDTGPRDILTLTAPVDPGDQRLGDLLRTHQLVDADTLHAILVEARRQRRSLRQTLLASGAVTVYQLALIETGNVGGLMLGPFRVVDRLRQTEHETHYRVFDPRRGQEAILRQLGEQAAADAILPDEYRERFRALILPDAHVAATLEVLDVGPRPAVLQESLAGLPATDWPPLAAAPGVCYRLLTQAALGLAALHRHGLCHGRLSDASLVLTPAGNLKLCGAGEPTWLGGGGDDAPSPVHDLRRLGAVVSGWCTPSGVRKGPKTKPLPDELVAILFRLQSAGTKDGYASARDLLDDLERAGDAVAPNPEAWDRLLRYVRDHATTDSSLRQSA